MNDEPKTCRYCGGTLAATHVQGQPELVELNCRNADCGKGWVNQAARCNGPSSLQVGFREARINRLQRGKPSQGEDNCQPVARAMLAWLGDGFEVAAPCPEKGAKRDSAKERGFDFSIREPCGHTTEVQVTRVPEKEHFAALGAANRKGEAVVDERPHSTLIGLIESALRDKTDVTPSGDRAHRILAIDGRDPSVGFNFFLTGVRFTNTQEVFGWHGVVLVIDERNMLFFGREGWPDCPECGRCR